MEADFLAAGVLAWRSGLKAARPYREIVYLEVAATQLLFTLLESLAPLDCYDPRLEGNTTYGARGGAMFVDKDLYYRAQGYDERFEGWGREDVEWWNRLSHHTKIATLPGRLLHLHHVRFDATHQDFRANHLVYRAIALGIIPPQTGAIGDPDKYRHVLPRAK